MAEPATFVGRDSDKSRLRRALDGSSRMVLVVGDAGVGKTRFVRETTRAAAETGMLVLLGECLPLAEARPLLPVIAALSKLTKSDDGKLVHKALETAPEFVRAEVGRLTVASVAGTEPGGSDQNGQWRRERLFAGLAGLFQVLGQMAPVTFVVEDVHWADSQTLDFLLFVASLANGPVVVATCRGDEAPVPSHVAEWLMIVRGTSEVEEIWLDPLSRPEIAELIATLAGGHVPSTLVDELYLRAEGNPFFTEQLVAAGLAEAGGAGLAVPARLPARLAGLLTARADRCNDEARAVLAGLAVAGRPLIEDQLRVVTGLDSDALRRGLRELAAARLLDANDMDGGLRPKHALLAEAVTAGLLPSERASLHERIAHVLESDVDRTSAAEAAAHWQAAGCLAQELQARLAAAPAAEAVFAYRDAADHLLRAIALIQQRADEAGAAAIDVARLYLRAVDALHLSGRRARARELAEDAYVRFADHANPEVAAAVHARVAALREFVTPMDAKPLMERALQLLEPSQPSAEKAGAWLRYATSFLYHAEGQLEASRVATHRALEIAERAGDTETAVRALAWLAFNAFLSAEVDAGQSFLKQAKAVAIAVGDDLSILRLADYQSTALLRLGRYREVVEIARQGLDRARQIGLHTSLPASFLAADAAGALLALGCPAEAGELIDPITRGRPDRDHWSVHQRRAQIDLLRGDVEAALARQRELCQFSFAGTIQNAVYLAQDAADVALWAQHPGEALDEVQKVLPRFQHSDLAIICGAALCAGMRACADLAEQARARQDKQGCDRAQAAASQLIWWVDEMSGRPLADHPYLVTNSAERASWEAELTRMTGESDPQLWASSAILWAQLGRPHRVGYAMWRQAQALLIAGGMVDHATRALRSAAEAAVGHEPLLAQISRLASRARISLDPRGPRSGDGGPSPRAEQPYGLTKRELDVLRLLATGRSNAQIAAELYISRSTAGVHVSAILRKLGVPGRVQAATLAERAGLLDGDRI